MMPLSPIVDIDPSGIRAYERWYTLGVMFAPGPEKTKRNAKLNPVKLDKVM